MRLVTLYRANFGTALENFSLAVFRGKLGEFPTWPIVLHYGDDKVYSPRARAMESYMCMYIHIFSGETSPTWFYTDELCDFVYLGCVSLKQESLQFLGSRIAKYNK